MSQNVCNIPNVSVGDYTVVTLPNNISRNLPLDSKQNTCISNVAEIGIAHLAKRVGIILNN